MKTMTILKRAVLAFILAAYASAMSGCILVPDHHDHDDHHDMHDDHDHDHDHDHQ